jgi:regulator of protease activity HflC (stomatin/prohibitin superfamily)
MIPDMMYVIVIIVIFLLMLLSSAIKIMAEYQRIVIFRLGRLLGIKGPGLVLIVPIIKSSY